MQYCTSINLEITPKLEAQVLSMQQIAKDYPEELEKKLIYVFWEDDDLWYRGQISKFHKISRTFKIKYDDSNVEKLDLTKQKFILEDPELRSTTLKCAQYKKKGIQIEQIEQKVSKVGRPRKYEVV